MFYFYNFFDFFWQKNLNFLEGKHEIFITKMIKKFHFSKNVFMLYSMFYKSIKHHKIKILTHKLYWLSSKWVYIQFKYDIKTWKNKLFFLKIDIIFILAFLILVYHMDENGKQRNFTKKHQTPIYKKCYLRVWVCFFFVVREQDHKTPQKKNVIVFGFSAGDSFNERIESIRMKNWIMFHSFN